KPPAMRGSPRHAGALRVTAGWVDLGSVSRVTHLRAATPTLLRSIRRLRLSYGDGDHPPRGGGGDDVARRGVFSAGVAAAPYLRAALPAHAEGRAGERPALRGHRTQADAP